PVVVLGILDRVARQQLVYVVVRIREVPAPTDASDVIAGALLADLRVEAARNRLLFDVVEADRLELVLQQLGAKDRGLGRGVPELDVSARVALGEALRPRQLRGGRVDVRVPVPGHRRGEQLAGDRTAVRAVERDERLPADA